MLGKAATERIVKETFFKQFCGGETTEDLKPCIDMLNRSGINGILDYAAEVSEEK